MLSCIIRASRFVRTPRYDSSSSVLTRVSKFDPMLCLFSICYDHTSDHFDWVGLIVST